MSGPEKKCFFIEYNKYYIMIFFLHISCIMYFLYMNIHLTHHALCNLSNISKCTPKIKIYLIFTSYLLKKNVV